MTDYKQLTILTSFHGKEDEHEQDPSAWMSRNDEPLTSTVDKILVREVGGPYLTS